MHNGGPHGHHVDLLVRTPEQVTEEVLSWTTRTNSKYWLLVLALASVTVLGVIGFIMKLSDEGLDSHMPWGYLAAGLAFILTTSLSAPLIALAPRLAKAHWTRPISRIAEIWSVAGLLALLILIPLLVSLPSAEGRNTMWFYDKVAEGWPVGAPHLYIALGLIFLVLNGFGLLWASAIPDFAAARERTTGWRNIWYTRLSLGWVGTKRQWRALRAGLGVLGAFYFMMLVFAHTYVSFDFAQSLVPGMRDSIMPTWQALGGIQSALATVIVTSFIIRAAGGFKDYINVNQFWSMAKLMLASSLLWMYFWWSGFIVLWYGKTPLQQDLLQLMWFGPYKTIFIMTLLLSFAAPLLLLMWNGLRKSIWGPALVSLFILLGAFLDKIRIYVSSYSVENVTAHTLEAVPEGVTPDSSDIMMLMGVIAGAILLFTLAVKFIPVISMWEVREGMLLQEIRPLKRLPLKVIAKPE
jgi:molybdopterin-containing oxidoreductase family membrane subunit